MASSTPQKIIEALMDELDIRNYFQILVSACNLPGKTNAAVFLEAARRLGVAPDEFIVVEDSIAGVEAARRAGMRCIAVANTNPIEALKGADFIVNSLEEWSFELIC